MPMLFIHAVNAECEMRDEGADYDAPDAALALAVEGAVSIAAEEVRGGQASAAVVVSVEQEDGTPLLRSVVALSVASLVTAAVAEER